MRRVSARAVVVSASSLLLACALLAVALLLRAPSQLLILATLAILVLLPLSLAFFFSWGLSGYNFLQARTVRNPVAVVLAAAVLVSTTLLLSEMLDAAISRKDSSAAYNSCHKIWSTRGLVQGPQAEHVASGNNAVTIRRAFEHGARGVEVDMFYDVAMKHYVVSHDRPYELKNGALLFLETLLQQVPADRYFWIDLKKLRHLRPNEAEHAAVHLREVVQSAGIPLARVYVEGADPFNLGDFRDAGFPTILDSYPLPEGRPFAGLVADIFKAVWFFGDFTVMSMNYGLDGEVIYGNDMRARLAPIPLFIYHVPDDPELLRELVRDPLVRALLVHDHQADRFSIDDCNARPVPAT